MASNTQPNPPSGLRHILTIVVGSALGGLIVGSLLGGAIVRSSGDLSGRNVAVRLSMYVGSDIATPTYAQVEVSGQRCSPERMRVESQLGTMELTKTDDGTPHPVLEGVTVYRFQPASVYQPKKPKI